MAAIYNTPAVSGLNAYNLGTMNQLFTLYGTQNSSGQTIGVLNWTYVASGLSGAAGQAWTSGGNYYIQLDASGGGVEALVSVPQLPGDANGDGKVDINDLTVVLTNFGLTAGAVWSQGDFQNDGKVDINDLTIVLTNFGQTVRRGHQGRAGTQHLGPDVCGHRRPAVLRLATAEVRRGDESGQFPFSGNSKGSGVFVGEIQRGRESLLAR